MASRAGGGDRISTKAKLAAELALLGRVIVRAREERSLKQIEVAERLGMPASYLSKIEKGTRRLDVIELLRVAEAIGVEPERLVRELAAEIESAASEP